MKLQPLLKNPIYPSSRWMSRLYIIIEYSIQMACNIKSAVIFFQSFTSGFWNLASWSFPFVRGGLQKELLKMVIQESSVQLHRITWHSLCASLETLHFMLTSADSNQLLSHHIFNWKDRISWNLYNLNLLLNSWAHTFLNIILRFK